MEINGSVEEEIKMHADEVAAAARPRFYFVSELATEMRRSEAAVRWLIYTGQIHAGKLGGRVVVSADELDRVIAAAFTDA